MKTCWNFKGKKMRLTILSIWRPFFFLFPTVNVSWVFFNFYVLVVGGLKIKFNLGGVPYLWGHWFFRMTRQKRKTFFSYPQCRILPSNLKSSSPKTHFVYQRLHNHNWISYIFAFIEANFRISKLPSKI